MARIKTGSIVADIRGKVGSEVYSRNRGGSYVKAYAGPRGAAIGRQADWQSAFQACMTEWRNPGSIDRDEWIAEAERLNRRVDAFGSKKWTGRGLFLNRAVRTYLLHGFFPFGPVPSYDFWGDIDFSAEIISATGTTLSVTSSISTPLSDTTIWGMFSNQMPPTVYSFNSVWQYVYLSVVENPNNPPYNLYTDWNNFFGSGPLTAGNKIFFKYAWLGTSAGLWIEGGRQIITIT